MKADAFIQIARAANQRLLELSARPVTNRWRCYAHVNGSEMRAASAGRAGRRAGRESWESGSFARNGPLPALTRFPGECLTRGYAVLKQRPISMEEANTGPHVVKYGCCLLRFFFCTPLPEDTIPQVLGNPCSPVLFKPLVMCVLHDHAPAFGQADHARTLCVAVAVAEPDLCASSQDAVADDVGDDAEFVTDGLHVRSSHLQVDFSCLPVP